jgi:molecular chaperone GrpE
MTNPNDTSDRPGEAPAGADPDATTVLPDGAFAPGGALEQALAAETAKASEHYANYVRVLAELDNFRKRAARDAEQARRYAIERFAQELLPALDGFELGEQAGGEASVEAIREGAAATRRLLMKAFESAGISAIAPAAGEPFNPEQHEAMVAQPAPGLAANTIVQTIQKGYVLNGRVLRAARVIVASGA